MMDDGWWMMDGGWWMRDVSLSSRAQRGITEVVWAGHGRRIEIFAMVC